MENAEEIMHYLEVFSKRKPKSIPPELNDYLSYVARTGDPVFQWGLVKCLFKEKLLCVLSDFYENSPGIEIPSYPNVDTFNYDSMKNSLLERLDSFLSAPFTLQRICELLIDPRNQYNRIDKFLRAIEKNILVVSTREPGSRCIEQDQQEEPADALHNGSDNNLDYNFDVEMEEVTCKESRHNKYKAYTSSSDHRKSDDDDIDDKKSPEEPPVDRVAEYEAVTPPDDSANDHNDTQESDSTEEDKADDSSNSSDEVMPKISETENSKTQVEKPILVPKIEIDETKIEETTDEKESPKLVCEIIVTDEKPNNDIANNEATEIPNNIVKTQVTPIKTDHESPSNDDADDGNTEDVTQNEDVNDVDANVTDKMHAPNENVDQVIVEQCELQSESISEPHIEVNKTEHDAIKAIDKVQDEPNATELNIEVIEASPKSSSITNSGDDAAQMEFADSAATALAKDDNELVIGDQHVAEAKPDIAKDKQTLAEDDNILAKEGQHVDKAVETSELTDSST